MAYGAATLNWSAWTFAPDGELGAWLEGAPLPVVGCPFKQAEYDGRCRGARFRAAEIQDNEAWLDKVVMWIIPEDGQISLEDLLAEASTWPSVAGVTMRDIERSGERLKRLGLLVDCMVAPEEQLNLLEAAQ